MADIALGSWVADNGIPATARAMGITRQRIYQMQAERAPVWLRVRRGKVVGWYAYRSCGEQGNDNATGDTGNNNGSDDSGGVRAQPV